MSTVICRALPDIKRCRIVVTGSEYKGNVVPRQHHARLAPGKNFARGRHEAVTKRKRDPNFINMIPRGSIVARATFAW
jgi:hypothetical protein